MKNRRENRAAYRVQQKQEASLNYTRKAKESYISKLNKDYKKVMHGSGRPGKYIRQARATSSREIRLWMEHVKQHKHE